jgi:protein-tyrosine phosphatase
VKITTIIENAVYLSPIEAAFNIDLLNEYKITHIVDISFSSYYKRTERYTWLDWPLQDTSDTDIASCFNKTNAFIDTVISRGGRVLVHCNAAVSRSVTLIVAYLMYRNGWTFESSLKYVEEVKPIECIDARNEAH